MLLTYLRCARSSAGIFKAHSRAAGPSQTSSLFPSFVVFALWETALLTSDVALDRMISAVADDSARFFSLHVAKEEDNEKEKKGCLPSTSVGKLPSTQDLSCVATLMLSFPHWEATWRPITPLDNARHKSSAALSDSQGPGVSSFFLALSHLCSFRFFSF